jgi:ATP-binding cassette, subfamily B, bacterial PglK
MLNEIILLIRNLDQKEINYIKLTIFFIILSTFFQFFSIATLVLVISVFFEKNFYQNNILLDIKDFLNFDSNYNFKLFIVSSSLILLTLTFFFSLINVFLISSVSNQIGARLESVFFNHYVNCKYINITNKSLAKILSNLKDCLPRITNYFFPSCLNLILNLTMFLIIIMALLITNFYVTLFCFFLLFFLYFFFYRFLRIKINSLGRSFLFISEAKTKFTMYTLSNLKIIKFYNFNKFFENKFLKLSDDFSKVYTKILITETMPRILVDYILYSGTIFFLLFFFYFYNDFTIDYAKIVFFIICLSKLLPTINQIFSSLVHFNSSKSSVLQYNKELSYIYSDLTDYNLYTISKDNIFLKNRILLNNVEFAFNKNFEIKLNDFEIKKGNFIGFSGKSGSGKTTCLDIISGIIKPNKGSLLIDDQIINDKNIYAYRSIISYVPQEIYLGDLKIWEIIAFGQFEKEVNMERIIESAKNAEIHNYILSLPDKYDTYFGDEGVNLSGGQKQRLAIARGLYKSAQILLLDEVTSGLDRHTEELFVNSIKKLIKEKSLIVIFVSHRVEALKDCDQIYIFNKGLIENYGSYSYLKTNRLL